MNLSKQQLWERFQKHFVEFPTLGLALDLSRMNFSDDFFKSMEPRMQQAFSAMADLENALHLRINLGTVVEIRILPIEGMTCRCVETAFAHVLTLR